MAAEPNPPIPRPNPEAIKAAAEMVSGMFDVSIGTAEHVVREVARHLIGEGAC